MKTAHKNALVTLLQMLSRRLHSDGNNDMSMPDTPANRKLAAAASAWDAGVTVKQWKADNKEPDAPNSVQVRNGSITISNVVLCAYLQDKIAHGKAL